MLEKTKKLEEDKIQDVSIRNNVLNVTKNTTYYLKKCIYQRNFQ